jgi:hypothetical protein
MSVHRNEDMQRNAYVAAADGEVLLTLAPIHWTVDSKMGIRSDISFKN